ESTDRREAPRGSRRVRRRSRRGRGSGEPCGRRLAGPRAGTPSRDRRARRGDPQSRGSGSGHGRARPARRRRSARPRV
ncbi:MAG: hypothetical protein AVDCRST_MAG30-1680, partial [uncultured Solirubrobacteraceae bacterium]